MSDIDKKLEDLNDFADLLRPEQRYYTNLIKDGKFISNYEALYYIERVIYTYLKKEGKK